MCFISVVNFVVSFVGARCALITRFALLWFVKAVIHESFSTIPFLNSLLSICWVSVFCFCIFCIV